MGEKGSREAATACVASRGAHEVIWTMNPRGPEGETQMGILGKGELLQSLCITPVLLHTYITSGYPFC